MIMGKSSVQHKKGGLPKLKVGTSRQVAIPKKIYDGLRLSPGDYLEADVKNDRIVLTPKVFVEKRLAEGLSDIKRKKVTGPFSRASTLKKSLRK